MKLSDVIGLNPELPDAEDSLAARFDALKIRTTALGVVSAAVFGVGALWSLSGGVELWSALRGAAALVGTALHVPAALWPDGVGGVSSVGARAAVLLPIALLAVWVLGIWGWSNGRLWGARRYAWMGVVAVLSLANFTAQSASFSFGSDAGGLQSKQLKAAAAAKRWDEAEAIVTAQPDSGPRRYVQAQIALLAGDSQGLRKYAQPLIEQVDFYVMDHDPMLRGVQAQNLSFVKPPVVYALEVGLYGAPKTELALALHSQIGQRSSGALTGRVTELAAMTATLVATVLATLIGALGLLAWHAMTQRVFRLQAWVERPYDYGDEQDEGQ